MLAGYIDGDGHSAVSTKENRTTAFSCGQDLSLGMQRLAWSLGIPAVRCQIKSTGGWHLSIANGHLTDLVHFSWKVKPRRLQQTTKVHGFYHAGKMYLPVRSISAAGPATVFNFEVAGDHTYNGPNIDSHNCNRNGDGFTEETCIKYCPTFEKFAWHFRDHKNKPDDPFYGRIVKAAYNPEMKRIELLKALFNTKAAAERHGPRGRPADKELEKLAANKEIPVSMSCLIPFDECFRAGTLVDTAIGMQPIETVSVNTQVRTHLGRYRRVSQVRSRDYAGTMVDLTVTGVPETVSMTKNHPVFAVRREQFATCRGRTNGQRRRHTLRRGGVAVETLYLTKGVEAALRGL
jgi:hypothetical protein